MTLTLQKRKQFSHNGAYLLLLLALVAALASGQYYMYTPGAPWPASIGPLDMFGGMIDYCNCSSCPYPEYPAATPCVVPPGFDASLCQELNNATRTPYVDTTHRYGLASESGTITIDCGNYYAGVLDSILMVYTTDGTLPDMKKAKLLTGTSVIYNSTNPTPRIAARCQVPGRAPSKIAYMTRVVFDASVNGTWCSVFNGDIHYKEMPLPTCDRTAYGSACDGQTIITSPSSTPTTTTTTTPATTPTPSPTPPKNGTTINPQTLPSPSDKKVIDNNNGSGGSLLPAFLLLLPLALHS